jgi:hypothetical protein
MRPKFNLRSLAELSLLASIAGAASPLVSAQGPPPVQQPPPVVFTEETQKNPAVSCVEPPPMVRIEDYDGPFKKTVGAFARPLERKAIHPSSFKSGAKLCTLKLKGKFFLFVQDSFDPVTFVSAGFDAALDQAEDSDPRYRQGSEGFGRRYGAEFVGQASVRFFNDFFYPSLFSEDPRYYRLAHGGFRKRFFHAMGHSVIAHHDDGSRMFNFSIWFGTTSSVVLSNTYHPDNERGFLPAAQAVTFSILQESASDVFREFWPEISRKLHFPFRGQQLDPSTPAPATSPLSISP